MRYIVKIKILLLFIYDKCGMRKVGWGEASQNLGLTEMLGFHWACRPRDMETRKVEA